MLRSAVATKYAPQLPMNDEGFHQNTKHLVRATTALVDRKEYFDTNDPHGMFEAMFSIHHTQELDGNLHAYRPHAVWTQTDSPRVVEDCVSCCIGLVVSSADPTFLQQTYCVENILQAIIQDHVDQDSHQQRYIPLSVLCSHAVIHGVAHIPGLSILLITSGCVSRFFLAHCVKDINDKIKKNTLFPAQSNATTLEYFTSSSSSNASTAAASCLRELNKLFMQTRSYKLTNSITDAKIISEVKAGADAFLLQQVTFPDFNRIIDALISRIGTVLFDNKFVVHDKPRLVVVFENMLGNPLLRNCKRGCLSRKSDHVSLIHMINILSSFDNDTPTNGPTTRIDIMSVLQADNAHEAVQQLNGASSAFRIMSFLLPEKQGVNMLCVQIQDDINDCIAHVFSRLTKLHSQPTHPTLTTPPTPPTPPTHANTECFNGMMRNACSIIASNLGVVDLLALRHSCITTFHLITELDFALGRHVIFPRKTSLFPPPTPFMQRLAFQGTLSLYLNENDIQQCNKLVLPHIANLRTQRMQSFISHQHMFSALRSLSITNNIDAFWTARFDFCHLKLLVMLDINSTASCGVLSLPRTIVGLKLRNLRVTAMEFESSLALQYCNIKRTNALDHILRAITAQSCKLRAFTTDAHCNNHAIQHKIHTDRLFLHEFSIMPWNPHTFVGVEYLQMHFAFNVVLLMSAVQFCSRIKGIRFVKYSHFFANTPLPGPVVLAPKWVLPSLQGLSFQNVQHDQPSDAFMSVLVALFQVHVVDFFAGHWSQLNCANTLRCFIRNNCDLCPETKSFLMFEQ